MPSIDKLRHNIRHAVSLSAFSPNLIHRIRYFFLYTVTFRDYSYNLTMQYKTFLSPKNKKTSPKSKVISVPNYIQHKLSAKIKILHLSKV